MHRQSTLSDDFAPDENPTRTCSTCGERKRTTEFYGRMPECKACSSARARAWAKANPDKVKATRERNAEKLRALSRKRHQERSNDESFKERNRQRAAEWRANNRDKHRAYAKQWRTDNLERSRELARKHQAARRLGKNAEAIEYSALLANDPCSYCGARENITIDHIVPVAEGGGNTADNLTAACYSCNSRKRTRSALRFLMEVGRDDV